MNNWKIHLIHKCDNCGSCWEVRVPQEAEGVTVDDFRTMPCDNCEWECVGLTAEEADIWWAIVDNEETEDAEWQEW
jgi:hypothetical protein